MKTKLSYLLEKMEYTLVQGDLELIVEDLIYDSRKAKPGMGFICMVGAISDGHAYVQQVIDQGVRLLVVEKEVDVPDDITVVRVSSTRKALAYMSAALFGYPAQKMTTIGITGTKGKTTAAHMLRGIFQEAGKKYGIIGTIGAYINQVELETINTTPESYELHRLFAQMVEAGCEYMVMEVASQGVKLHRVLGIEFDYGIFTNLSPDHIGPAEHADFNEYLQCKRELFRMCKIGILNCDDEHYSEMIEGATCKIYTFGTDVKADLQATEMEHVNQGGKLAIHFQAKGMLNRLVQVHLPGRFNIYNAMCAISVSTLLGISEEVILDALSHVQVKGRVEPVAVSEDFTVLIDYAHNEVSSRSVLTTLREYNPTRIVSIFGCGGNRAKMRRFTMGEAIGELSDLSIITADNSRDEDVLDIIDDIKVGMNKSGGEYVTIPDRQEAVTYAIRNARKGDMIVLLGKGHEEYQEVKGVKRHFSEREAVANAAQEVFGIKLK